MKRQAFQPGEIRDNNDNIIRPGAYGKKTALATSDNMGILDYIINNFDALYDAMNGGRVYVKSVADLPKTGDVAAVYIAEDTGKWYYWDPGTSEYVTMDNARTIANEAIAARDAAKSSQTAAKTSEINAKASETSAKTSETNAASSASAASASESAAKTSETNAANSQTAAASSASSASTSATKASDYETNAKTALVSCQNIQTQVNAGLQSLTSAVKYRGSIASFSDVPTSGQEIGDLYNVKAAGGTDSNGVAIKAGDNVVWNGSGWDDMAGIVDLSDYYKKTEINSAITSTTVSDATITFIHKDASKTTATVNNVAHATKASQDDNGQAIDIAALKTLITSTVNAAVLQCKKDLYPVGSVYVSITDSRNPADILGFGTWEALPAGYGLVAQGTATAEDGSTLTFTAGQKSGEFKHQLTVGELAKHKHLINWYANAMGEPYTQAAGNGYKTVDNYSEDAGNDEYHNNVAPCIASYLWKRTA